MSKFFSNEKYQEILDTIPICTVDVLFFNKDLTKTLLFKRNNSPLKDWYFSVGGRLYKDELLIDCAVRQVHREIGVTIDIDRLMHGGVQEEIHTESIFENTSYHAVDVFYGYILEDPSIKLDSQHSDYKWFSVSDASLNPFIKTKISSILKNYGQGL